MNYLPPKIVSIIIFHLPLPFLPPTGINFTYRYLFVAALELFFFQGISLQLQMCVVLLWRCSVDVGRHCCAKNLKRGRAQGPPNQQISVTFQRQSGPGTPKTANFRNFSEVVRPKDHKIIKMMGGSHNYRSPLLSELFLGYRYLFGPGPNYFLVTLPFRCSPRINQVIQFDGIVFDTFRTHVFYFQNIDFAKPCLSCSPQSISPLRVCIKALLVDSYVFKRVMTDFRSPTSRKDV